MATFISRLVLVCTLSLPAFSSAITIQGNIHPERYTFFLTEKGGEMLRDMPTVSLCTTTVSPAKPIPLVVAATYTSPFIPLNANKFHESKHEKSTCYNFAGGEALPVARCSLANVTYSSA